MYLEVFIMAAIERFRGEYSFLSNFAPCKVQYGGKVFPTVEHAFQAAKCLDEEEMDIFLYVGTPEEAKKWGRVVKLRPDWEEVKVGIMEDLVRQKFTNPKYKELLIKTGDCPITEGNTWGDTFWGVCKGKGQNNLGKIIMKIRKELFE